MKLNDMTLADIDMAAARNAEQYVKPFKGSAKSAFIEGACWAYEYLTKQGNTPAWCEQKNVPSIRPDLLEKIKAIVAAITVLVLIYLICVLCAWLGGEAISLDFLIKLLFQWLVAVVLVIIICAVTSGLVSWTLKDE